MIKKLCFLFVLAILMGCDSRNIPEDVLSQDKMIRMLIDIHIAEGKATNRSFASTDSSQVLYKEYEDAIFKKHKVSKKKYKKSYKFYEEHPELLDEIYGVVVDSLSLRQQLLKLK